MNNIVVKNLVKNYKNKGKWVPAVDNISFNIKKNEIFGFLGPNGAGKSTTINMLSGILTKDSGEITILGKDPEKEWEFVKNRMNCSSAYFGLSDILTLRQNLRVYAKIYNVKNHEELIDQLLIKFELNHLRDRKASTLSSGERTRLTLCKGLINTPQVLLLDECTVGLDPDIAEKTRNIILDYKQDTHASILFTSHYMYEVEELCKRIAFMGNGKIVKIDTAEKLKKMIKKQQVQIHFLKTDTNLASFFKEKEIDIVQAGPKTIHFEVDANSDRLYRLMNSLFKRGYKIRDLNIKRPTLDDIFIRLARKK